MAREIPVQDLLRGSPVGHLVPISGHDARFGEDYESEAFIPSDLPDRIDLPGTVWMAVSEAMSELGRLDAAASLIPNPALITRITTRRKPSERPPSKEPTPT